MIPKIDSTIGILFAQNYAPFSKETHQKNKDAVDRTQPLREKAKNIVDSSQDNALKEAFKAKLEEYGKYEKFASEENKIKSAWVSTSKTIEETSIKINKYNKDTEGKVNLLQNRKFLPYSEVSFGFPNLA